VILVLCFEIYDNEFLEQSKVKAVQYFLIFFDHVFVDIKFCVFKTSFFIPIFQKFKLFIRSHKSKQSIQVVIGFDYECGC